MKNLKRILIAVLAVLVIAGGAAAVRAHKYKAETLSLVLSEEEFSELEKYTELKELDLSGSRCYDRIMEYISSHPQVSVSYDVEVGSSVFPGDSESIELTDISQIEELSEKGRYMPELKEISVQGPKLSYDSMKMLADAFPDARISCDMDIAGKTVSSDAEELDLSNMKSGETDEVCKELRLLGELRRVSLGRSDEGSSNLSFEDVGKLQQARPDVIFDYGFSLYGHAFSTADESIDLSGTAVRDRGEAIAAVLPYMKECRLLDMDSCGVSNEDMASIRDAFPEIKVVWRVFFGDVYSARTDTDKILASIKGEWLTGDQVECLKYCTDVKYIDLGHNTINDISFVAYMPDLEVAILAINYWKDAAPLANCTKLEYLEIFNTFCSDVTPLAGLTNLHHLNISWLKNLNDISPLYGLKNLERLWIGWKTPIPAEQVEEFKRQVPGCVVNTVDNPTSGGWRKGERYKLLREQFGYDEGAYSFR